MTSFAKRLKLKAQAAGRGQPIADMLATAERAVEALRPEFEKNRDSEVAAIRTLVQALRAGPAFDVHLANEIHLRLHNLKGQGATFGYPALSEVGETFCRFVSYLVEDEAAQSRPLEVIVDALDAHVQALTVAAATARDGDRTALARELQELGARFRRASASS